MTTFIMMMMTFMLTMMMTFIMMLMMIMTMMMTFIMMMMTHISDPVSLLVGAPHISNAVSIAGRVLSGGNNWISLMDLDELGWLWMELNGFGWIGWMDGTCRCQSSTCHGL